MEVTAILKARALAMIEIDELSRGGKIRLQDCIGTLVQRYDFSIVPSKPEDFDLSKGVKFESGKFGGIVIDSLVIFSGAMYIDTRSSTDDSRRILEQMLVWGRDTLGLTYEPNMVRRWGNISQVLFRTDFPLLEVLSPALKKLAQKTSAITEDVFSGLKYEPASIIVGHDPMVRQHSIAGFTIQHRTNTMFSDNKFYSEAPLPTNSHIQFLEELEKDILSSQRGIG